jgi:hypothetical protein
MLRSIHLGFNAQPVPYHFDISERFTCLRHTPGTGIHAQENDFPCPRTVAVQIKRMGKPGIAQWVVDMRDRWAKCEIVAFKGQVGGYGDQIFGHLYPSMSSAGAYVGISVCS